MVNQSLDASRLRLPAWLLITSTIPFIAIPVTAVAGFVGTGIGRFDTITPQQMAIIRTTWILLGILGFSASLLGTIGIAIVSNALKETKARPLAWIALVGAVGSVVTQAVFTYLRLSVINFTEANLGMVSSYPLSNTFSYIGYLAAMLMTCMASATVLRITK